ncbi:MAG: hypothetical protein NC938_06080 [Candidatus Omnitrophica bacterium]|nr:hypothetical protein [Candidatus Omnitrophota bacterium]MCM8791245.1 hypothetical protein [Candidatus Omnitrophota bacterium]
MTKTSRALLIVFITLSASILAGCATIGEGVGNVVGLSISDIEGSRSTALTKVFDDNYDTCYEKVESLLRKMPEVSIYGQDEELIVLFWKNINTTPVGVYFKKIDASRTEVAVASPSTTAREWIAKNIFEEKILQPPKPQKFF